MQFTFLLVFCFAISTANIYLKHCHPNHLCTMCTAHCSVPKEQALGSDWHFDALCVYILSACCIASYIAILTAPCAACIAIIAWSRQSDWPVAAPTKPQWPTVAYHPSGQVDPSWAPEELTPPTVGLGPPPGDLTALVRSSLLQKWESWQPL